jgi:hypothetical protein
VYLLNTRVCWKRYRPLVAKTRVEASVYSQKWQRVVVKTCREEPGVGSYRQSKAALADRARSLPPQHMRNSRRRDGYALDDSIDPFGALAAGSYWTRRGRLHPSVAGRSAGSLLDSGIIRSTSGTLTG